MRVNPSEEALRNYKTDPVVKQSIDRITRFIAIAIAFLSTFSLFIKILFF